MDTLQKKKNQISDFSPITINAKSQHNCILKVIKEKNFSLKNLLPKQIINQRGEHNKWFTIPTSTKTMLKKIVNKSGGESQDMLLQEIQKRGYRNLIIVLIE